MTLRTPYDGAPYYCSVCGKAYYEMGLCPRDDCGREDVGIAMARRDLQANMRRFDENLKELGYKRVDGVVTKIKD